jgi:uncharacterized membrane protein
MLIGLLLAATWASLTILLPIVAVLRTARALQRVEHLEHEVARLAEELGRLRHAARVPPADPIAAPPPVPDTGGEPEARGDGLAPDQALPPLAEVASAPASDADAGPVAPPPSAAASLETRIGARWLLYAGVVTLILGASYFIKYAFDNNWITPRMRVTIGAAGGAVLFAVGRRFAERGLVVYGHVLTAAGIVVLYVAVFAAVAFYGLMRPAVAFAAMAAITVLAAHRAHRAESQGLALLAVAGGFLTPFLVGGDAKTPHLLFAYAALLVLATVWLARQHAWPPLHLVSFVMTGVTVGAWAGRFFTADQWLATELWLTLFAVLFGLVWKTLPQSTRLWDQLARLVIGTTPFVYHAASLQLLWPHAVGLLVYLIATTLAGVIVAGHTRQHWIRLVTWLFVALPALQWVATRPARWDSAAFIAIAAIYTLHLVAQTREAPEPDERPRPVDVFLVHANGLWLWAGAALLLERLALDWLAPMTLGLALWYSGLTAAVWSRNRETALHFLALAGAFVAAAVAFQFDGAAVTAAWVTEGGALIVLALATGRRWLHLGGAVLLAAGIVRLVLDLVSAASVTALPVLNPRSLTALFVVGLLAGLAWRYRKETATPAAWPARAVAVVVVTAALLLLLWATSEVDAAFARAAWTGARSTGAGAVTSASLGREVTRSTLWAGYGVLLIGVGIRRRYAPLRLLAITLLGLVVAKVFLIDLARLDRFYRILSTVGLGLLLLGGSYLYQRFSGDRAERA